MFPVILQIALSVYLFLRNRGRKLNTGIDIRVKKDQNSSNIAETSKEVSIDDSLLDEDDSSVHNGSQRSFPPKSKSLEDKLDRFFTEFENFSHRLKSLEDKNAGTFGSRTSSDRDSLHVARQPMVYDKALPARSASSSAPASRLERRSATITRAQADQQSTSGRVSDESNFSILRRSGFRTRGNLIKGR